MSIEPPLNVGVPGALSQTFTTVEAADQKPHRFSILQPTDATWLPTLAKLYRELRTATNSPVSSISFNNVEVLDVTHVKARLNLSQVPQRHTGNFAVERSDLAELALMIVGEELRGYSYGYRSIRDRELRDSPGRGIDQIGVRLDESIDGGVLVQRIVLMLGEAKHSSSKKSPPAVVDASDDGLSKQHKKHLTNRTRTADQVWTASKNSADSGTAELLQLAAHFFETEDPHLTVVATNLLMRPALGSAADYGSFATAPADYEPAEIDFLLVRIPTDDVEIVVDEFLKLALDDAEPEKDGSE